MPDNIISSESRVQEADGFVVVSVWTPGKYNSTRHTYDHFNTLDEAIAHHTAIREKRVEGYAPNGIFAAMNGLPVGGALNLDTLQAVSPSKWRRPRDGAQSTPENRMLKEMSLRDRRVPVDATP